MNREESREEKLERIVNAVKEARKAGLSEDFIKWSIDNYEMLEMLSDDNFETKPSKDNKEE